MPRSKVEDYQDRLEEFIYNGNKILRDKNSIYLVNGEKVMIVTGKPNTNHYFFTMNPSYLKEVDNVLFVCGNDLCAFKIPSNILRSLPFCTKGNERPKTKFDMDNCGWYLTFNKDENGKTQMDISEYFYDLKSVNERIEESQLLRYILLENGGLFLSNEI